MSRHTLIVAVAVPLARKRDAAAEAKRLQAVLAKAIPADAAVATAVTSRQVPGAIRRVTDSF